MKLKEKEEQKNNEKIEKKLLYDIILNRENIFSKIYQKLFFTDFSKALNLMPQYWS